MKDNIKNDDYILIVKNLKNTTRSPSCLGKSKAYVKAMMTCPSV